MPKFSAFIGVKYSFHTLGCLLRPAMMESPNRRVLGFQSVSGRNKCKCDDSLMPRGGREQSCAIQNFMPRMVGWNVCFEK